MLLQWRRDFNAHAAPAFYTIRALKGPSMEKWLCWGSMGLAGVLLILFVLDMIIGLPFGGIGWLVDGLGVAACGLVAYLGWESYKELR